MSFIDDNFGNATIVLGDKHFPKWIKEKAKASNIPVVTLRWIVECLVKGKIVRYDKDPNFLWKPIRRRHSRKKSLKRTNADTIDLES